MRDYVVARYGDFVLLRPPFKPETLLLWGAPLIALAGGALALWAAYRRRGRRAAGGVERGGAGEAAGVGGRGAGRGRVGTGYEKTYSPCSRSSSIASSSRQTRSKAARSACASFHDDRRGDGFVIVAQHIVRYPPLSSTEFPGGGVCIETVWHWYDA